MAQANAAQAPGTRARAALIQAAVDAIVAEGWQAAGSRSVTSRAGVPLGALNYHFGSKEGLFRHAAMLEIQAMFATPWALIAGSRSIDGLVEALLRWSRSPDVSSRQQALLLEAMAQSKRDADLATALQGGLSAFRDQVAAALHRLGVVPTTTEPEPTAEAAALAAAFTAHCNGLWLQYVTEPQAPHEPAAEHAIRAWQTAFRRSGPEPRTPLP
ncbi:TetR/AcrR family transcriptional regulator [Micromonospora sp. NPDC000089]|uniref:TetR/AcrR family transcriptional regulator n=1 Tax=unclassified Micromonospora TaxID=2617518 RepID=UPI00368BBBFB